MKISVITISTKIKPTEKTKEKTKQKQKKPTERKKRKENWDYLADFPKSSNKKTSLLSKTIKLSIITEQYKELVKVVHTK